VRAGERAVDASDDFGEQWRLSLGRVRAVVESAGGAVTDIIALRVYVTDLARYRSSLEGVAAGFGEVLGRYFPAITMVQVSGLVDDNALVEIEAVASVANS
jgi:enamine deaminase RidA (YjgF/YER057c/UK114 family)